MPRTSSALKAQRSSLRKTIRNARQSSQLERAIRLFRHAETKTTEAYQNIQKQLDKAAKTHVIERSKASRLKSRLAKLLTAKTETIAKTPKTRKTKTK